MPPDGGEYSSPIGEEHTRIVVDVARHGDRSQREALRRPKGRASMRRGSPGLSSTDLVRGEEVGGALGAAGLSAAKPCSAASSCMQRTTHQLGLVAKMAPVPSPGVRRYDAEKALRF